MEHVEADRPEPAPPATDDRRPYEPPRIEAVQLSQEAAESLT